jgi:hypothetical protein
LIAHGLIRGADLQRVRRSAVSSWETAWST